MAFVNEYIREEDIEKYDLRRICGEHNLANTGHMYARDWTVDHERGIFLLQTWSHRESDFGGWAFFWDGGWIFFDMKIANGSAMPDGSSCWFLFQLKGFAIPQNLEDKRANFLNDLEKAFTAMPGGVTFVYLKRSAKIEFIKD